MDDKRPIDRRRFFREGLRELLKPLASAVEPIEEVARQFGQLEKQALKTQLPGSSSSFSSSSVTAPVSMPVLRPPGALLEERFLSTCSRCAECVRVCPAQAIKIDFTDANLGNGMPRIEPDAMPCVVCDGLQCMHHCPSGALAPTALAEIDMGTAVWHESTCVRSKGQECTICIDRCPIGSVAIELRDGKVHVIEDGCIGCGVCQHYCPTIPKSITIIPRRAVRDEPVT